MKFSASLLALLLATTASAADKPAAAPKSPAEADTDYTAKIEDRTTKLVDALKLTDPAQAARVHALVVAQYRAINTWHDAHDAELKTLAKTNDDASKQKATEIKSSLKKIHDDYLAALSAQLPSDKVEAVKDLMALGKVDFTYRGYLLEYPGMNDAQKAKVLGFLKEARDEAIDAGSTDEKSNIFNRYKGRINNWLSKEGVQSARAAKAEATKSEKR
jgi:hypothetical protein